MPACDPRRRRLRFICATGLDLVLPQANTSRMGESLGALPGVHAPGRGGDVRHHRGGGERPRPMMDLSDLACTFRHNRLPLGAGLLVLRAR